MVVRMSLVADRQAFCVAASGGDCDPGMSPVMSRVSVIRERDSFAGMSLVMSRVPVIRERGDLAGMSPVAVGALGALCRGGGRYPAIFTWGDRGFVSAVIKREE